MSDCTFTHVETHSCQLSRCPLCAHEAELWELVDDHGVFKFACCGRSEDGGLGLVDGCPLNHPPRRHFYMPTLREAANRWNDFAGAAGAARTKAAGELLASAKPSGGNWEVIDGVEVSPGMSWIRIATVGSGVEVCVVRYVTGRGLDDVAKANARLIAAAPELLQAAALYCLGNAHKEAVAESTLALARTAIHKATGKLQ